MCGGIPVHIVSFTVGGGPSVEITAVPTCEHGASALTGEGKSTQASDSGSNNLAHKYLYITASNLTISKQS
jgi:hypothetical protein